MLDIFKNLEIWVTTVMEHLGEPGVGLLVLLENLFPPIPSEVILPLAGFTASRGEFLVITVIFWATLGSIIGAVILYYVGALLGRDRTRALFQKIPLVRLDDVDKTEAWFIKHEAKTVFYGRMVPIFRSLISIPAGVERMNMGLFVAYTTAGSLIWNSTLIGLGFTLGENFHLVEEYVSLFQYLVIVVVTIGIGYFVARRLLQRILNSNKKKPNYLLDFLSHIYSWLTLVDTLHNFTFKNCGISLKIQALPELFELR